MYTMLYKLYIWHMRHVFCSWVYAAGYIHQIFIEMQLMDYSLNLFNGMACAY